MQIWFLASTIAVSFHSFWSGDRTCTAQPGLVVVRFRPLVWCGRFSTIGCGRILRENWPQGSGTACFPSFSVPGTVIWYWYGPTVPAQSTWMAKHKKILQEKDVAWSTSRSNDQSVLQHTYRCFSCYAPVWNYLTFIWIRCLGNTVAATVLQLQ